MGTSESSNRPPELAAALAAAAWGTRLEIGGSGGKALARKMPSKRSLGRRKVVAGEEAPSFGEPPLLLFLIECTLNILGARMLGLAAAAALDVSQTRLQRMLKSHPGLVRARCRLGN